MSVLDNMAVTAKAYASAGNLKRALEICSEILGQDPSNFEAFECLFDVLLDKQDYRGVNRLCEWRLGQHPNCVHTNIKYLILLGSTFQQDKAQNLIMSMRESFGDRPRLLQEANILHSHYFGSPRKTLRLIERARNDAMMSRRWLDYFERFTHERAGHIFAHRRFLERDLEEDPNDPDTLLELGDVSFLTGQPFRAMRLAKRGKPLNPAKASRFKVLNLLAKISLCPLVWGAQFVIFLKVALIDRAGLLLMLPLLLVAIALGGALQLLIISPFALLGSDIFQIVKNIAIVANIIWGLALIYSFDLMDNDFSDEEKSVKLSRDY